MRDWVRVVAVIAVPLAVIAAVVLFEALRVAVSRRRRAELRQRVQDLGVATTVLELLRAQERERAMNTTASAGPILHFDTSTLVRSATAPTSAAGRQPVNATRYIGAVPVFAKPEAPAVTVESGPQKV